MKRCQRTAIEITVEFLLLVLLLIYITPTFFRSQRNQSLVLLFKDMDRLICATEQYKLDFGSFPQGIWKGDGRAFCLWGEEETYTNSTFPEILCDCGYLKRIPDFSYMQRTQGAVVLKTYVPEDDDRPIYAKAYWSFASYENHVNFMKTHFDERYVPRVKQQRGYAGAVVFPMRTSDSKKGTTWYAPSNGVDSAGFVYLDSHGEHSPFGNEIPRLLILAMISE